MNLEIAYVVIPGFIVALSFTAARIYFRKKKSIVPAFQLSSLKDDFPNGFVLPQCFELVRGLLFDQYQPNPTALIFCVFYTTYLIADSLQNHGRDPRLRTRKDD